MKVITLFMIILVMHLFTIRKHINVIGCERVYFSKLYRFLWIWFVFCSKEKLQAWTFGLFLIFKMDNHFEKTCLWYVNVDVINEYCRLGSGPRYLNSYIIWNIKRGIFLFLNSLVVLTLKWMFLGWFNTKIKVELGKMPLMKHCMCKPMK
jgi:hypothetical protein